MPVIPINLEDLVLARTVETNRLEFKTGLDDETLRQVTATISAFANDFHNLNGGYIILGISEKEGVAQLPPAGIPEDKIDEFQKKIRGQCNRISPEYYPVVEPAFFQGHKILVIWCPAGEARPYQAPPIRHSDKESVYYIRQGSETVEARGEIKQELLRLTARIPYDDRAAFTLDYEAMDPALVKRFLADTRSKLAESNQSFLETCQDLRIVRKTNGHFAPLHVGLLFFSSNPGNYFSGAYTELAQFGDDASGNLIEEISFQGPIQEQIRNVLRALESSYGRLVQKLPNEAEAQHYIAFPYAAMEEAVVNAFYHRSYDANPEPIKIYLYPDRMEIISYPGPVPGIKQEHFAEGNRIPPVQNRNRRVGDFLKQLGLAEMRNTGIPTIFKEMKQNGSPAPVFDFDEDRSYFRVTLPAHPRYITLHAIREAAYLWVTGQKSAALSRLSESKNLAESGLVWGQLIEYKASDGNLAGAETEWTELNLKNGSIDKSPAARAMARAYLLNREPEKALNILRSIQSVTLNANELTETALLYKNLDDLESAHLLFERNISLITDDPRALNEFADIKLKLAKKVYRSGQKNETNIRLLNESADLFRKVIQLTPDNVRKGWCWFRLAEIYEYLRRSKTDIEFAFQQAFTFLPNERVIQEQFNIWRKK